MCRLSAVLCSFSLYQSHQCFWPMYAFRFLSLANRRLDSDLNDVDENQKAFHFRTPKWLDILFLGFGYNGLDGFWHISLFSIFILLTIKLKAGTGGTGPLLSSMHLPSPEKRWLYSQLSWILLQRRKKRGSVVLLIGEHSMMCGTLLTMGLGVPFSFFQEKKCFCCESLVYWLILKIYWIMWSFCFSSLRITILINYLSLLQLLFSQTL